MESYTVNSTVSSSKEDEEKARQQWSRPIEFLLSCIAMSVGLGNVWRFPSVAYKNGGGAFLIPYLVVLFVLGKPLYFLELALGQFTSYGCVGVWNLSPAFRGIGYGQMIASTAIVSYYVSIMAVTLFYMYSSFASTMPWTVCNPDFVNISTCVGINTNVTANASGEISGLISSADAFYTYEVQKAVDTMENGIGVPEWRLVICLLISWLAILFTMVKGVQSSGKVAYFTALFPYVVLITLLIRGVTLPGAFNGILFYLQPKWSKLLEIDVWSAAVTQCFFSLSVGFGVISMLASFNGFRHNVARDATIISIADMATSFVAGLVTFSILGNLASETNQTVEDVARGSDGAKLAFVTYPTALANFPAVPQLFAVMFFLMLFTLGLGSASALAGCSITVICDLFPKLDKWKAATFVCTGGFLVGLVYVTPAGNLILNLVDTFGAGFVVLVLSSLEVVILSWVYGIGNLSRDFCFMLGHKPNLYSKVCWAVLMPIILIGLSIYQMVKLPVPLVLSQYTTSALAGGWALAVLAFIPLPICFIHAFVKCKGDNHLEKLKTIVKPNSQWGPMLEKDRLEWLDEIGVDGVSLKPV